MRERRQHSLSASRSVAVRRETSVARRRAATVTLLAGGGVCVTALHVLRPELEPRADRISEYAIGRYGPVMTAAFLAMGLGALVMATLVVEVGGRWSRGVGAAIGAAGVGLVMAGIWRTDPTRSGVLADSIHSRASALATVTLIGAALAWSVVRHPRPRRFDVASSLAVIAAVLGASGPALHDSSWSGASQRLLWLVLLAWLIVTGRGLRLRSISGTSADSPTMTT